MSRELGRQPVEHRQAVRASRLPLKGRIVAPTQTFTARSERRGLIPRDADRALKGERLSGRVHWHETEVKRGNLRSTSHVLADELILEDAVPSRRQKSKPRPLVSKVGVGAPRHQVDDDSTVGGTKRSRKYADGPPAVNVVVAADKGRDQCICHRPKLAISHVRPDM